MCEISKLAARQTAFGKVRRHAETRLVAPQDPEAEVQFVLAVHVRNCRRCLRMIKKHEVSEGLRHTCSRLTVYYVNQEA